MSEMPINSYYSSNLKAERPKRAIASGPVNLPSFTLCKDEDLNKKMRALNNDIYQDSKREKRRKDSNFWKWFGGVVVLVVGIRFFRNRF